jgi:hypothetical protein
MKLTCGLRAGAYLYGAIDSIGTIDFLLLPIGT